MRLEFSRPHRLGPDRREVELRASPAECAALAARYNILGLSWLRAQLVLVEEHGGAVRARGGLEAKVTQACVVTLEPVVQFVEVPVELRILPEGATPQDDDPDSPDEIESEGGLVDLGEVVAEQLALALDPYPRAAGAALPAEVMPEEGEEEEEAQVDDVPSKPNPFAALARLKRT